MTSGTGSHGASESLKAAVEVDPVRVVLTGISASAVYSLQLHENRRLWACSSQEIAPSLKTIKGRATRSQPSIALRQSRDQEVFTFGSSPRNDVFLRGSNDPAAEDDCYINYCHLEAIPDPDHDALALYNLSTTAFSYHPLEQPRNVGRILPCHEARLGLGIWQINIGKGLDFELTVKPYAPDEAAHNGLLIPPAATRRKAANLRRRTSSSSLTSSLSSSPSETPLASHTPHPATAAVKSSCHPAVASNPARSPLVAANSSRHRPTAIHQPHLPSTNTFTTRSRLPTIQPRHLSTSTYNTQPALPAKQPHLTNTTPEALVSSSATTRVREETEEAAVEREETEVRSYGPSTESPTTLELIGQTFSTKVYKTQYNGAIVAVKVCRRPELQPSAHVWRNELESLRILDHASSQKCLTMSWSSI